MIDLRENDIGVRVRGDEYAAILIDTDRETALKIAGDLRSTLYNIDLKAVTGSDGVNIRVSIGIAMYPDDTGSSADLVNIAREKMMAARGQGGDKIIA